jgi:phosphopantetheinyl transferase
MPLIIKENINTDCIIGVWETDESAETLHRLAGLTGKEEAHYLTLKSQIRRKQWLSYHAIIRDLLGDEASEVTYDAFGKPFLCNKSHFLSVSHSGDYSAVIVSRQFPVGIDIEKIRDRVERVKDMFLSKEEVVQIGSANKTEKMIMCWGAKESLYKIYGNPELLCMKDITIDPFDYLCSGEGSASASVKSGEKTEHYSIFYRKIEDYILVYAFKLSKNKKLYDRKTL